MYRQNIRSTFLKIAAHSVSEGSMEALRGGHFAHGFFVGAASSAGGEWINGSYTLSVAERIAANAALGGIVSEIGGGKFASGAMTAAYVMMFNELKHKLVLCDKQQIYCSAILDSNVGLENFTINVNTAVVITPQKGGKYNIEVCATSDCEVCYSGTLTGGFESTLIANGQGATKPIPKTKGLLFSPRNCNFSGNLLYKNIELFKFRRVSINIHGGWNYDSVAGHFPVGVAGLPGVLCSASYDHKFKLK